MPIRVAIVEDDPELRVSIGHVVQEQGDMHLVSSSSSAEEFRSRPEGLEGIDVVLMDIDLPGITGIECITEAKPKRPEVQYLICSIFEDNASLFNALCAGATGYLLKSATAAEIVRSIHEIQRGGSPMSLSIARMVVDSIPRKKADSELLESLTKRERELLDLLAEGYLYKEIGDRLSLSIETVRTYIRAIYTKLQVHSRTDALNKLYHR